MLRQHEYRLPIPKLTQSNECLGVIVLGGATGSIDTYKTHGHVPLVDAE
jgi:hypothetical protein